MVGGLALLFFGLRVMARGRPAVHRRSGPRACWPRSGGARRAALGLGVAVGGITQFTTTAAGLVVGLVESHLIAVAPAVAVLLGAQLGAAVTPSVLGLVSTREGLLVLSIGVLWLALAVDRRSEAFGKIILGCGLLFFGLHLLRQGFEPLVSNPELLPYIDHFDAGTLGRAAVLRGWPGVLLTALLQGPAPVFVLVLGLAQSTGPPRPGQRAGHPVGHARWARPSAPRWWPARSAPPRGGWRGCTCCWALAGTLLLAATARACWPPLADALVPGTVADDRPTARRSCCPTWAATWWPASPSGQVLVTVLLVAALPGARPAGRASCARRSRARRIAPLDGSAGASVLRDGLVARAAPLPRRAGRHPRPVRCRASAGAAATASTCWPTRGRRSRRCSAGRC